MGLLLTQGIDKPFSVMIASIKYNFYPLVSNRDLYLIVIFIKKGFWIAMKKAEKRTKETGLLLNEGSKPMVSDEVTSFPTKRRNRSKSI